jgi:Spore coat protein (Spore_GerQ).
MNNKFDTLPTFMNESSYLENVLKLNKGKKVDIYASFPNSNDWKNKTFEGIIEESGKDYVILSNPATGSWHLLSFDYIDFIKSDEKINATEIYYPNA